MCTVLLHPQTTQTSGRCELGQKPRTQEVRHNEGWSRSLGRDTNTHLGSGSLPILIIKVLGAATFLAAFILGHKYVEEVRSRDRKYRMDQNTHWESLSAAPCASSVLISRMKCHYRPDILLNAGTELQKQSRSSTGPRSHPTQEPWEPEWIGDSSYR